MKFNNLVYSWIRIAGRLLVGYFDDPIYKKHERRLNQLISDPNVPVKNYIEAAHWILNNQDIHDDTRHDLLHILNLKQDENIDKSSVNESMVTSDLAGKITSRVIRAADFKEMLTKKYADFEPLKETLYSVLSDYRYEGYDINELYDLDAGVSEGYTIGEHTALVNEQLNKMIEANGGKMPLIHFIDGSQADGIQFYRMLVMMHDLGKGVAYSDGEGHKQSLYNSEVASEVMDRIGFDDNSINLAKALLSKDVLGGFLRGFYSPEDTESSIRMSSQMANMSVSDYFGVLENYYTADSSSYPFLHDLVFDESEDGELMIKPNRYPGYYELKGKLYGMVDPDRQIKKPKFKRWFGDWQNDPEHASKVVDENGKPKVVYHGTTHDFKSFEYNNSNMEGFYGNCHYFTDAESDASDNYAGIGPDLTSRIDLLAERLSDMDAYDLSERFGISEEEAEEIVDNSDQDKLFELAKKELVGEKEDGVVMPVYLNMRNPVIVNGQDRSPMRGSGGHDRSGETLFYYEPDLDELKSRYDEEEVRDYHGLSEDDEIEDYHYTDMANSYDGEIEDNGNYTKLSQILRDYLNSYDVDNIDQIMGSLEELKYDGFTSGDLENLIRHSDIYIYDINGEMVNTGTILRDVYEQMGYDGIILNNADRQFSTMHIPRGTTHYHVFNNKNIKSSDRNSGDFSDEDSNIYAENEK